MGRRHWTCTATSATSTAPAQLCSTIDGVRTSVAPTRVHTTSIAHSLHPPSPKCARSTVSNKRRTRRQVRLPYGRHATSANYPTPSAHTGTARACGTHPLLHGDAVLTYEQKYTRVVVRVGGDRNDVEQKCDHLFTHVCACGASVALHSDMRALYGGRLPSRRSVSRTHESSRSTHYWRSG